VISLCSFYEIIFREGPLDPNISMRQKKKQKTGKELYLFGITFVVG